MPEKVSIRGSYNLTNPRRVQAWVDGPSIPAVTSRLSGTTMPAAPQAAPANLVPQPAGEFDSSDGWSTHPGLTITNGVARWDGSHTTLQHMMTPLTSPMVLGRQYGFLSATSAFTSGFAHIGVGAPITNADSTSGMTTPRNYARRMTAASAHPTARFGVSAGAVMDIEHIRVYDLSSLLEKKWRIVFVYAQSNWIGAESAPDQLVNDPPEPRAIVIPSIKHDGQGAALDADGLGLPMPLADPVPHMTISQGGPSGAFARTFCNGLRDDEVLVYVATGYAGGSRMAADGVWNRQTSGAAWLNLLKQVDGAIERAPAGSTVAGMLFCQGEDDRLLNAGDQHAGLIREDIELLRARYGLFPVVINEIGFENLDTAGVQDIINGQKKLDSSSEDPLSIPHCRYVTRPAGSTFVVDGVHYDQVTQRKRGAAAASALLGLHYGT